jgi:hypothetical protein
VVALTDHLKASREIVLIRAGGRCEHCGARTVLEMSHRIARGMGGTKRSGASAHSPANLAALCSADHRHVEAYPFWAYSMGLKIRRGGDPLTTPIVMWDGRWLLDDDGLRLPITEA